VRKSGVCLLTLVLLLGCGKSPEGPAEELPAPVLLPVPDDLSVDEGGVDAVPEKNAIQIQWEAYPRRDARIQIYRSDAEEGEFSLRTELSATDTVFLDERVAIGTRYWYFLIAKKDGSVSPTSDTVSYKLLEKPFALWENPTPRPTFRWRVSEIPVEYVIKLFELPSDNKVWFAVVSPDFNSLTEEVRYNFDGGAARDSLVVGRAYRWRVDVVGPEANAGSESEWRIFVCQ